jgi:hypothetical protein
MFQFVEMNDDEITRIGEKNGVNTFQSLKDKRGDLQAGKLRHISRRRQQLIWECILWYEDFLRINQREPKWNEELTKDAICNFKANNYTIPSFKRESLRHVLEVLQVTTTIF